MEKSTVKQSEIKADEKSTEKSNVRMKKGSIIVNIEKRQVEDYKRQGFNEI